jgi:N6-adenosine-specific RNA methylase IME4
MKYSLIYADPPWAFRDKASAGKRGAVHKYPVMSFREICALPVGQLAADDCLLAMWWVPTQPREALAVVEAWGFELVTMKGFTWAKKTIHGKWHIGMGTMTRANSEDCLIARRGRPKRLSAAVRQLVPATIRQHSRKPDEVRAALVQLVGDVPRIELFARTTYPGWDVWGNEVESNVVFHPAGVTRRLVGPQ